MLIIIIGFLSAVGLWFLAMNSNWEELLFYLGFAVLVSGVVVGLFVPVTGYTEWEQVEEEELVSLSTDIATSGNWFAIRSDGIYSYRIQIKSEFGTNSTKEYEMRTCDAKKVVEVEDPNITTPVLKVYKREGKGSFISFAFWTDEEKYVFYVPSGTIKQNLNLD